MLGFGDMRPNGCAALGMNDILKEKCDDDNGGNGPKTKVESRTELLRLPARPAGGLRRAPPVSSV